MVEVVWSAVGYRMHTICIDCNDMLAVLAAMQHAQPYASEHNAQILTMAMIYRFGTNSSSDDPYGYRSIGEEIK